MNLTDVGTVPNGLTDQEFAEYWAALGTVVRIATRARHRVNTEPAGTKADDTPGHDPASTTTASTERRWSPTADVPASPFGFGQ